MNVFELLLRRVKAYVSIAEPRKAGRHRRNIGSLNTDFGTGVDHFVALQKYERPATFGVKPEFPMVPGQRLLVVKKQPNAEYFQFVAPAQK